MTNCSWTPWSRIQLKSHGHILNSGGASVRRAVALSLYLCLLLLLHCVTLEIVQIVQQLERKKQREREGEIEKERTASVCFNFSYRQAAASTRDAHLLTVTQQFYTSASLATRHSSLPIPYSPDSRLLTPDSPVPYKFNCTMAVLLFCSYNFKMNSWLVLRSWPLFDGPKSARSSQQIELGWAQGPTSWLLLVAASYLIETCLVTPLGQPIKCLTLI